MWRYIALYQIKCYYYLNNITRPTTIVRYSRTPLFVYRKQDPEAEKEEEEEEEVVEVEPDEETIMDSILRSLGMAE